MNCGSYHFIEEGKFCGTTTTNISEHSFSGDRAFCHRAPPNIWLLCAMGLLSGLWYKKMVVILVCKKFLSLPVLLVAFHDRTTKGLHHICYFGKTWLLGFSFVHEVDSVMFWHMRLMVPGIQPQTLLLGHTTILSLEACISRTNQHNVQKAHHCDHNEPSSILNFPLEEGGGHSELTIWFIMNSSETAARSAFVFGIPIHTSFLHFPKKFCPRSPQVSSHRSLEGIEMLKRHHIVHLKAE